MEKLLLYFFLTNNPKHDISSAKQVQNWYSGYIRSDAQLINTE